MEASRCHHGPQRGLSFFPTRFPRCPATRYPDEELRDALAGRSSGKSVSRTYGAKAMLERWSVKALKAAVDKISYPGLDLSRGRPLATPRRLRGTK